MDLAAREPEPVMNRHLRGQQSSVLLTGGAGFVGQYLLRELHRSGREVAVVLRSRGSRNASQRASDLLGQIRHFLKTDIPRIKVIDWDIRQPFGSGISEDDLGWIKDHVRTFLHAAASVRFVRDERSNEPFDSNVVGTQRMLELASYVGDVDFHYVSTAYVCGISNGVVQETLQPTHSGFRNVYEESKYAAEQLIESRTDQLRSKTIYRPSIVVGDSVTGYASNFQTVYTGLRLAAALPESMATNGSRILNWIGLQGTEKKNLVPVDWVAESIVQILCRPQDHHRIYHLTHPRPVTVGSIYESMARAIEAEPGSWSQIATESVVESTAKDVLLPFQRSFHEYFCDDPTFERKNIELAIPGSLIPAMDERHLTNMFRFALRQKLREPRESNIEPTDLTRSPQKNVTQMVDGWEVQEDETKYVFRFNSTPSGRNDVPAEMWIAKESVATLQIDPTSWNEACRSAHILCMVPATLQP